MHNVLGGTVDPHAAFLLLRGMKTLGIRVNQQNKTALEIATRLEAHPCVQRVGPSSVAVCRGHGEGLEHPKAIPELLCPEGQTC